MGETEAVKLSFCVFCSRYKEHETEPVCTCHEDFEAAAKAIKRLYEIGNYMDDERRIVMGDELVKQICEQVR